MGPKCWPQKGPKWGLAWNFFPLNVNIYVYKHIAKKVIHHLLVPLARFVKKLIPILQFTQFLSKMAQKGPKIVANKGPTSTKT